MRKRLYQPLPENGELIDNVLSTVEEKTKKRLYAESIVKENGAPAASVKAYNGPFAEKKIDTVSAMCGWYENEWIRISLAMYSSWYDSTSVAVKCCEWYLDIGKAAWKTGYGVAYNSASLTMQHLLPVKKSK
jgi:hypothetical protein